MSYSRDEVVLVSSGLGYRYGGIGVVSEAIRAAFALDHPVSVWRHPANLPRPLRMVALGAQGLRGLLRRPQFVFYEHVHLAPLHAMLPQLRGVPYGVFLHGTEVWQRLNGRRQDALCSADILVANSASTVAAAREKNPWLPQVKIAWLGVPRRHRSVDPGEVGPTACIVGRMARSELKGHDLILDAWRDVRRAVNDASLIVVGSGNDESRLRARVQAEGLDGVQFLGHVSEARRDEIYAKCRVFLFPSTQEGFGLAAAEAAGCGMPVVGIAGTVMSELFPPDAAFLLREASSRLIGQAAIRLFTDAELAARIGRNGRRRVLECFLEEHFVARFRTALDPMLPAPQPIGGTETWREAALPAGNPGRAHGK